MTPPRSYDTTLRREQQEELRRRIVEATARLHARQGGLATTYAQIAAEAGVSLPTVHKYFPHADDVFRACTAHVAAQGPQLPVERILAAPTAEAAARALVDALDALHAHFEPWLAWREHEHIDVLARLEASRKDQLTGLCAAVLERHRAAADVPTAAAVWESVLGFEMWHRLVHEHGLPRERARGLLVELLLGVCGPRPAVASPHGPKRKQKS